MNHETLREEWKYEWTQGLIGESTKSISDWWLSKLDAYADEKNKEIIEKFSSEISLKGERNRIILQIEDKVRKEYNAKLAKVAEEIEKEMLVDSAQAGQFSMHSDGYNQGLEDSAFLVRAEMSKKV